MKHWVIGSLNVDLVVDVARFPDPGETVRGTGFNTFLGGKGGNQAMALARLGGQPSVIGRVGDDQFGRTYRDSLAAAGATVEGIATDDAEPTGTALIEVETAGNNRIVIVSGANGTVTPEWVAPHLNAVERGDTVLLQLEIPMETVEAVVSAARDRGAVVILDPAPADTVADKTLRGIDWITPNEHEASVLTGIDTSDDSGLRRAAVELQRRGVGNVVIKAGARGALYLARHLDAPLMIPSFSVSVVDTTAAGDSFNAGLAWALGEGATGEDAIRTAAATAALSITGKGAQSAMPDAEAVRRLLEKQG
ncbi:MAG: ribokinase [Spirochaeta sp.]|jgi:ribokinase|nr:ribokinase [Spirochaeta sp.]